MAGAPRHPTRTARLIALGPSVALAFGLAALGLLATELISVGSGLLPSAAVAADERPWHWGADAEGGAPYLFKDPDDPTRNIGFEVDLIAALARQLNHPIEFHQYNYDSLVSGLERRDFDFAMNGLEVTPDRARRLRFSRPYYVYHLQLVVRSDDKRLRSLDDCRTAGATVGTLGETAASRLLASPSASTQRRGSSPINATLPGPARRFSQRIAAWRSKSCQPSLAPT